MKNIFCALLILSCCPPAFAAADEFPDLDLAYQKHILPNGLTLILHEDHKAPIVTARVYYHVGSKDEKPGKTGFAHLFEHLMLNGSQHYNDDFFKPLEQIGATNVNGTTNNDRTNYYATVPTPGLDRLLWMLSDQMGYLLPAVTQPRLDEQRGVVKNEKRQRENQPYGKLSETITPMLYPAGHPYSWTTIGSMEDLDGAALDDVRNWFKTWYGAANATLVVAGDIKPDEVKAKVEQYFGAFGGGGMLARLDQWIPQLDTEKRGRLQDQVPQTLVTIVWPAPGRQDEASTQLAFAADVLGGGKNSRLYKRLVYTDQSCTQAMAWMDRGELASEFTIQFALKPGADAVAAEKAAMEELAVLIKDGPTREELARSKTSTYAGFVRSLESISGQSTVLAESQLYGGTPDDWKRGLAILRAATPETIRASAQRWLGPGRVVLTVDPAPEYAKTAKDADRSKLPSVGEAPNVKFPPFQRATLANGLKIVLAERHEAPVVQMNLLLNAGFAAGGGAKPGVPDYTASMLLEGTRTRDTFAIAQRAEELGAALHADADDDNSNVSLSAIKARLEPSMELFADVTLNPAFPEAELARSKPRRLAAIQQSMASPDGIAANLLPGLVYGEHHPYNVPWGGLGTPDAIRDTSSADLRAFYARWYRPDNAMLVVAGDTTLPEIQALAQKYFGGWKAPAEPVPAKPLAALPLPQKPRIFLVNRSGAEQSVIQAAQLSPPRADPDHQAMFVVNNVLGGKFMSRLNMNLREAKHWSYGVSSGRGANLGQSLFTIDAPVETAHTADALREIDRELRELLATRKPTAQEVREAKDGVTKSLPGSVETSGQLDGQMSYMLTYGLPDDYYDSYVDKLKLLGPAELDAAAKKLVQPQSLTWVVVGDLSKIEKPIRDLKLGEVKVLDAEGKVLR